mmetsp:Transcript_16304/g.46302  ORF Transcript_16304/g.46302 Transcript_16304/m.46302 type:complete len:223 (+) Transcript_16304:124-792(+)
MTQGGGGSGVGTLLATGAAAFMAFRAVRRVMATPVETKLSCGCGKVHGTVSALPDDCSVVLCYCESCRAFAEWLQTRSQETGKKGRRVTTSDRASCVVMVPKTSLKLDAGLEYLKLAQRSKKTNTRRFFASCCDTPMFNTSEYMGLLSILTANLDDNWHKLGEPGVIFPEFAAEPLPKDDPRPRGSVATAVYNVLRFSTDLSKGPKLDYTNPEYFSHFKPAK